MNPQNNSLASYFQAPPTRPPSDLIDFVKPVKMPNKNARRFKLKELVSIPQVV